MERSTGRTACTLGNHLQAWRMRTTTEPLLVMGVIQVRIKFMPLCFAGIKVHSVLEENLKQGGCDKMY